MGIRSRICQIEENCCKSEAHLARAVVVARGSGTIRSFPIFLIVVPTMPPPDSFAALMDRLKAGDRAAAAEVFDQFSARLIDLARRRLGAMLRRKVDPEDVLQSAFKSFFVRQRDGRLAPQSRGELWAVLVTLTLRKCGAQVDHFRAARRDVRRESAPINSDGSADSWLALAREPRPDEAAVLAELVEVLFRKLDGRGREILSLHLQGLESAEIKLQVGCSERTVFRVLQRVREGLEGIHESSPADRELPGERGPEQ
jgi:RNA polymerase sigma-70 factor (ECF subfamily)